MPKAEAEALAMKYLERVKIPDQARKYLANFPAVSNKEWRLPARSA